MNVEVVLEMSVQFQFKLTAASSYGAWSPTTNITGHLGARRSEGCNSFRHAVAVKVCCHVHCCYLTLPLGLSLFPYNHLFTFAFCGSNSFFMQLAADFAPKTHHYSDSWVSIYLNAWDWSRVCQRESVVSVTVGYLLEGTATVDGYVSAAGETDWRVQTGVWFDFTYRCMTLHA